MITRDLQEVYFANVSPVVTPDVMRIVIWPIYTREGVLYHRPPFVTFLTYFIIYFFFFSKKKSTVG
jgi:hypothetical protein